MPAPSELCVNCEAERPASSAPCEVCGGSTLLAGRYRVEAKLARGAVGVVFRARRLSDGQPVAVKRLQFHTVDRVKALELFEREASVLGQLDHPSIPAFYEWVEAGEGRSSALYIVQELIDGQSLDVHMRTHRVCEREVLELASELLLVLDYLHDRVPPVVHRDIKPGNLLVREGHDHRIALVDFGSVHLEEALSDGVGTTVTGTIGFMAPEQMRGRASPASDLYAVGALMLSLLTREDPAAFLGDTNLIELPEKLAVRSSTRRLLERLLVADPSRRLGTAQAASEEIARCVALLGVPDRRPALPLSGRARALAYVAAAVVLIGGLGAYLSWSTLEAPRAEPAPPVRPAPPVPAPRVESATTPTAPRRYDGLLAELPRREIPFPDGISSVSLGCRSSVRSTCSYLLVQRAASKKLDIVHLHTWEIVQTIELPSAKTLVASFAGGYFLLLTPETKEIQLWGHGTTASMIKKRTLDVEGVPTAIAAGSHRAGLILVVSDTAKEGRHQPSYAFVDVASLEFARVSLDVPLVFFSSPPDVRASADGLTFALALESGQGLGVMRQVGLARIETEYLHASDARYAVPGPLGRRIFTSGDIYGRDLEVHFSPRKSERPDLRNLPVEPGALRLELTPRGPSATGGFVVSVVSGDERRRLLDLGGVRHVTERARLALALPDRVIYVQDRGLLLVIPDSGDRLEILHLDLWSELARRKTAFIYVKDTPDVRAKRGAGYNGLFHASSSAGRSVFELVDGPAGLDVVGGDTVTWSVPESARLGRHPVKLRLSSAGGLETFSTFDVVVMD